MQCIGVCFSAGLVYGWLLHQSVRPFVVPPCWSIGLSRIILRWFLWMGWRVKIRVRAELFLTFQSAPADAHNRLVCNQCITGVWLWLIVDWSVRHRSPSLSLSYSMRCRSLYSVLLAFHLSSSASFLHLGGDWISSCTLQHGTLPAHRSPREFTDRYECNIVWTVSLFIAWWHYYFWLQFALLRFYVVIAASWKRSGELYSSCGIRIGSGWWSFKIHAQRAVPFCTVQKIILVRQGG